MKTIETKSNKAARSITLPRPTVLSLTGQSLINALTPETVDAFLVDKIKIAFRAKVRGLLEKTGKDQLAATDIEGKESWADYVPVYKARKVNKADFGKCLSAIAEMAGDGLPEVAIRKYLKGFANETIDACFDELKSMASQQS